MIGWTLAITLAMQYWNRNKVYSSVTLTLMMPCWCQYHIVNQAIDYNEEASLALLVHIVHKS